MRDFLLSQGHEVSVISDGHLHRSDGPVHALDGPAPTPSPVRRMTRRIDSLLSHHPFTARRIARHLRTAQRLVRLDLVEMEESFGWSLAAQQAGGLPVVTRLHGPHFLKPGVGGATQTMGDRLRAFAEGRAIRGARALTSPNGTVLEAARRRYGRVSPRAEVIPNPVPNPAQNWAAGACDPALILFVGRFDVLKGADTMLAAFDIVARRRRDARLILVGPDAGIPDAGGRLRCFDDYVREEIGEGARSRITFTGLLPPARIHALRAQASLTVVASRCENFPYAAVEAMAAGHPLISTAWTGSHEIISDGLSGWLVPVGDADALAARIEWVLDHPERAASVAAIGHDRCRRAYSIEAVGQKMERFYRSTLGESATA
jgi:hypothetical protein